MKRLRAFIVLWLACSFGVAQARPFFEIVFGLDYASLGAALAAALLGGFIRTCWNLADKKIVIRDELLQSWRDMIYSLIAGGIAYVFLMAVIAIRKQDIDEMVQAGSIVAAGALRLDFLHWFQKLTDRVGDAVIERAVNTVKGNSNNDQEPKA